MVSDLLARRAEVLLRGGAPEQVGEAMGRLGAARGFLAHAEGNLERPDLAPSPARDTVDVRSERLDALQAMASGGAPPSDDWYTSASYRVLYDCSSCHTYVPGGSGVPK